MNRATFPRAASPQRLRIAPEPASLRTVSDWLHAFASAHSLSPDDTYRLDLCAGELVTNILDHSGAPSRDHLIELVLSQGERRVRLEILDTGRPFDPGEHLATTPPPGPDAPPGGWGLRLVRRFSDGWEYERAGGHNRTTLEFEVAGLAQAASRPKVERGPDRRQAFPESHAPWRRADGTATGGNERSGTDRRAAGVLAQFEMFRGVPYALLEQLLAKCVVARFGTETVLLRPGDRNDAIAFVLEGRLRVHLGTLDSRDHVPVDRGRFVGELSVIDGDPVSAFVVAEAGTRVLLVDSQTLFTRLLPIESVNRSFLRVLTARVRRSSERIVEQLRATLALEQLQRDLRVAHDIQLGMLPNPEAFFPDRDDVDCAAAIRIAQEVGGDFYDVFFLDERHLFLTIGDVCGKGLSAALFMVRALTLLRTEATRRGGGRVAPLARIVERVNRQLFERNEASLFVTLFCAVLDTATGRLSCVNAGHNPALLGAPGQDFTPLDVARNTVVGILGDIGFRCTDVQLPPGSVLVLFTDGVTEAESETGEQFGSVRLLATLDAASGGSSTDVVHAAVDAVVTFSGSAPRTDDIAVLALRFRGADSL